MTTNFAYKTSSLPGPQDIQRKVLANGITIMTRSNFESPSIVVTGYVNAGSALDTNEKLGVAYFTSAALMRGTKTQNFQQIFDRLESAGASLGFGASVNNTGFSGRALVEDLPLLLDLLADCVQNPSFPLTYFKRLQAQLLTGLAIRAQDPGDMSGLTFDELLFGDHPYGRPEDGYTETIKRISQRDLVNFHKQYYSPQNMVIVIVGAIEAQAAFDAVERALGGWQTSANTERPAISAVASPAETKRKHIELPEKSQMELIIGTIGPSRLSGDFLAASLGNNILGQFGMMGRIGKEVREKAGLAYYASTSLNSWLESGSWEVSAGINPVNLHKATDLILKELKRFVSEPVSQNELADSQANYIGRLPLSLESNGGVANAILNLERFNLGLDYYQRYAERVLAVTPQQVLEVAQKYIDPDKLVIVSAGTSAEKKA
ncbi:MAG: pitrilysin family protein [Anaerolineaceae bacterium]|nr:pitrilysin family protein [Anaerolineaceae bacterium]